jgi:hypothetical protein
MFVENSVRSQVKLWHMSVRALLFVFRMKRMPVLPLLQNRRTL